ncbi:hypothetical protein [Kineothrix sp. MB12-C1]|uniref:hypothetical protein n=1 Tax=Kineothrix sp. MB12-C1 TaxID=3070215 RepID=UPI002F404C4D
MASINVAVALQKPLLIKGESTEPVRRCSQRRLRKSTGKKLIIWNIKSTREQKAQDGLYVYDTIQQQHMMDNSGKKG